MQPILLLTLVMCIFLLLKYDPLGPGLSLLSCFSRGPKGKALVTLLFYQMLPECIFTKHSCDLLCFSNSAPNESSYLADKAIK